MLEKSLRPKPISPFQKSITKAYGAAKKKDHQHFLATCFAGEFPLPKKTIRRKIKGSHAAPSETIIDRHWITSFYLQFKGVIMNEKIPKSKTRVTRPTAIFIELRPPLFFLPRQLQFPRLAPKPTPFFYEVV